MLAEVWITLRLLAAGEEARRDWKAKKADGIEVSWGSAPSAETMRKRSFNFEIK